MQAAEKFITSRMLDLYQKRYLDIKKNIDPKIDFELKNSFLEQNIENIIKYYNSSGENQKANELKKIKKKLQKS